MERVMGIEPTSSAWKAEVLPLNYTRLACALFSEITHPKNCFSFHLVEGGGFEPPKAEPSDLQSDPFDHSGTPPKNQARYCLVRVDECQHKYRIQSGFTASAPERFAAA